jgi:hypothetical protein
MRTIAYALLAGLVVLSNHRSAKADSSAASLVKEIAPLIGEDTYGLMRIDATKITGENAIRSLLSVAPALERLFDAPMKNFRASAAKPASVPQINDPSDYFKELVTRFKAVGGVDLILIFSAGEMPNASVFVVPLRSGSDDDGLKQILQELLGNGVAVEKKGNALVAGQRPVLARFIKEKPDARPELAPALEAAGGGVVQVLLLPTEDQRRVMEEVVPLNRGLSEFPAKDLARGVRWGALGIDLSEKPLIRVSVQAKDAGSATRLNLLAQLGLTLLGRVKVAGHDRPLSEANEAAFQAVRTILSPKLTGDRLIVAINDFEALKAITALTALNTERVEGAASSRSAANMKQILLALHKYASAQKHMAFPPQAIRSKDGKPLLSWRVAVLPWLNQNELYKQFHLDEPWDSEHNKALIESMPDVFRSPQIQVRRRGITTYLVPVGKEVAFTGEATGRRLPSEFPDGTANTIFLLDVSDEKGVIWTKPDDLQVDLSDPKKGIIGHYPDFFLVALTDGSVRPVRKSVSNATLKAAFTVAGGDTLGTDW